MLSRETDLPIVLLLQPRRQEISQVVKELILVGSPDPTSDRT
jgi:hypothetical protein